jgi:flavodoxin
MKICYIYHSESGHTRGVVDKCLAATGGEKIEVRYLSHHHRFAKYIMTAMKSREILEHPIDPPEIDVSGYDLLVIGSPVWGGRPTPAIMAAIKGLKGCEGKKSVVVVTCGGSPGESIPLMEQALRERSVTVAASAAFIRKDLRDEAKVNGFIDSIKAASAG